MGIPFGPYHRHSGWDWRKDGIRPDCTHLIGVHNKQPIVDSKPHPSGGTMVIVFRDMTNITTVAWGQGEMIRVHQDRYHKLVIDEDGIITHDFGSVPGSQFKEQSNV